MNVVRILCEIIFVFALIFNLVEVILAVNYCSAKLQCPNNATHIACKNRIENTHKMSSRCELDAKLLSITNFVQTFIVESHNSLRNMVARGLFSPFKPAARMATMRWNPELAKLAALNVRECYKEPNIKECRNTIKFKNVGQNWAKVLWPRIEGITVTKMAKEQISIWFDENEYTDNSIVENYSESKETVSHFAQMLQERATDIGCAILRQSVHGHTEQRMTCNYSYGNIVGQPVYTTTTTKEAATKCKTGTDKEHTYLCSRQENYEMN